ncbi:MAG: ABC transporter ATP-binding protein [Clostridia bacterium]|nr:ABC transporter ATP-binding protein [Clostridia bacterium]
MAYIERYFYGLKHNPREQKRFDRETVKFSQESAKGKFVPSVVPLNLVDLEKTRNNMKNTISGMIQHFSGEGEAPIDLTAQATRMIDYLKDRASEYAYKMSNSMAKHRAIELMKEVGIPEPQRRYSQYPFEFSGGMRQRIVIAIALSANPDILICDEPTTALDVTIQAQILDLINRLKKERNLSVIFITHDLGVVANMADRIAIMYAGKIVEYGTADEVFYDPRHPYTWALLASMPDLETKEKLEAIPGTPPNMILPPKGDAFAARNHYAMAIDLEEQPPMFQITETHQAATWLLHPNAPKVQPPAIVTERIERMRRREQADSSASRKGGMEA